MKTIRFMYQNWADTATLTYSTQNSNFPATYSKHRWPTRSWRSSSLGAPDYLKYNLGAAKGVQFMGIRFNNFTNVATVKFQGNPSDAWSLPAIEQSMTINPDLILNGGFDINALNWTPIDCTLQSYGYGESGNCLLMTRTGGSSQRAMQGVTGLVVGKIYWFSTWVKSGSGGDKPFNLFVYDYPVTVILLQLTGTSSGTWTQYSGYFIATTTSVLVYLDRNSADAGQMAFDTVSIYDVTPNKKIMPVFPSSTKTYQWWRISITDAANPDVYVEVGRVFIGPYWNPSINFVDEFAWDYVDPTLITESEGGQISSIQRAKFKRHSYLFKGLTEADKDLFEAMFADRGRAKDLWICEDADHNPVSDVTYYVRFADEALKFVHIQGTELYELMVTFEELR